MAYGGGLQNVGIWAIKDIGAIQLIDNVTGDEVLFVDYANTAEFTLASEPVYARGNATNMVSFATPREGTANFSLELSSMESMAFANGTTVQDNSNVRFYNREVHTIGGPNGTVTLKEAPLNNTAVKAYKLNKDKRTKIGTIAGVTVAQGQKVTSALTGTQAGDIVEIVYITQKQCQNFTIYALDQVSKSCTMILRCKGKTHADGVFVDMQLTFGNVAVRSEGNFNFDAENPTEFNLAMDILADADGKMCNWALVPDVV